jgi:hypothetical protein
MDARRRSLGRSASDAEQHVHEKPFITASADLDLHNDNAVTQHQERRAKWPLLMIGFGMLITVAWAGIVIWAAVAFFGDAVGFLTPAQPDPLEELWQQNLPSGRPPAQP